MIEGWELFESLLARSWISLRDMTEVILANWRRERLDDLLEWVRLMVTYSVGVTKLVLVFLLPTWKTFLMLLTNFFAFERKLRRFLLPLERTEEGRAGVVKRIEWRASLLT